MIQSDNCPQCGTSKAVYIHYLSGAWEEVGPGDTVVPTEPIVTIDVSCANCQTVFPLASLMTPIELWTGD